MKQTKSLLPHLAVLAVGTAVMVGGCFQNSLWFDESYTVGLMQHSLTDLIRYAAYDVHPHLYYILLKLFTLLFGTSMPVMRLFSVLGAVLLAGLGLTHLRRDFGDRVGFWFSFCTVFCGSTLAYALQIRMYTWAAFFVALAAIYCYRAFREPASRKNRVLFLVFSVCSAYTHYFGLFAVAALNLLTLWQTVKEHRPFKRWLTDAAVQIGAYLPGIAVALLQVSLNGAAWIQIEWPDLVFDLTSYHLLGDVLKVFVSRLNSDGYLSRSYLTAGAIFLALFVLAGVLLYRAVKRQKTDATQSFALKAVAYAYWGVLLASLTVSLFRPIYYIRYTVVLCALLFFMIACLLASFRSRALKAVAAVLLLAVFSVQTYYHYDLLYDPSADSVQEFIEQEVQAEDTFLFDGANSFVVTVQTPENKAYFYNNWGWSVQNTYRAFGPNARVLDSFDCTEMETLGARVWTVDRGICYEQLLSLGYREVQSHTISLRYHNSRFEMILMEKDAQS